ncbi:hypothetical protein DFH06DRAFT_1189294 [Mycena polygramma]|nr:hypothetical protein DFH06DRAFT_1189294 [Mycena polygramma]
MRTVAWTESPGIPIRHKYNVLAAIYPNLDVAGIPEIGTFDVPVPTPVVREAVTKALLAGQALLNIPKIPLRAFEDLWPRYWAWACFLYTFHEQLPWSEGRLSDSQVACNVLWLVHSIRDLAGVQRIVSRPETSGLYAMLIKAWASILIQNDVSPDEYGTAIICIVGLLQECWRGTNQSSFTEMIEGAGGSVDDLASLFVRHLDCILSFPERHTLQNLMYLSSNIFTLAAALEEQANPTTGAGCTSLNPLNSALLDRGIIPVIGIFICDLCRNLGPEPLQTLDKCLFVLGRLLSSVEGYRHLPDALEAGLLKCLIYLAELDYEGFNDLYLNTFWEHLLPSALVYYRVLSKMAGALAEVKELEQRAKFQRSQKFAAWQKFKSLATQRLEALAQFDEVGHVIHRVCDNMECNHVGRKTYFRRCSGCRSAYYCSAQCQSRDWSDGGHRESCALNRSLSLSSFSSLDVIERDFLRALLNHDYRGMVKVRAVLQQMQILNEHHTNCFTLFSYLDGLDVDAYPVSSTEFPEVTGAARWAHDVARAEKSEGGIGLHAVLIREGDVKRWFIVPLRTDTARTVELHS